MTERSPVRHELTTIGPVPGWWSDIFIYRQLELRSRIRAILRDAKVGYTRERFALACSMYESREVDVALDGLVRDQVVTCVDGRYAAWKDENYAQN